MMWFRCYIGIRVLGERDPLIRCDWGRKTAANLLLRGVDVQFRSYKGVLHDMDPREV
jgi:hypothetical protein